MKLHIKRSFIFLGLLFFYHTVEAQLYNDNCCKSYECDTNPFNAGCWDLQIQGGADPIFWTKRSFVFAVNPDIAPDPLLPFFKLPHFNALFRVPWIVGGQVGYHWCDNERIYLEFNYAQARGKGCVTIDTNSVAVLGLTASKYKLFEGYLGVRYYSDRWCDRTSFFVGGKLGFVHHKAVHFTANIISTSPITPLVSATPVTNLFNRNTVVSVGGNIGLDICMCGGWSFVLTGEAVASCGPRGNVAPVAVVASPTGGLIWPSLTELIPGTMQAEVRFPITAGIRYSF